MLSSLKEFIFDLFYPNFCVVCNGNPESGVNSICDQCYSKFELTNLENRINEVTNPGKIDRAFSGWYFNSEIQKVIHSLKYKDRAKLGAELGRNLGNYLPFSLVKPLDLLLPVPLHPVKKRDRGYNQALWIAKGLSSVWGIPMKTNVLWRVRYTKSQTTLSVEERQTNMKEAIRITKDLSGKNVGIVDDVLTTGSTIASCAKECKNKGAKTVVAITCCTPKIIVE